MAKPKMELTEREQLEKNILDRLADLGGKAVGEEDVEFGEKFTAPKQYRDDIRGVIRFWQKYLTGLAEPTRFEKKFPYKPWDGAVAVANAFKKAFGTVGIQKGTPPKHFFDTGDPPRMIEIPISATNTIQVPWGDVEVPIFRGTLHIGSYKDDETKQELFMCTLDTAKMNEGAVLGLWKLIEAELAENSIYRGKAFDGQQIPKFLDLRDFREDLVVYNQRTLHQLRANIWVPILTPEKLDEVGAERKRAVLLRGTYGVGKTLAAMMTAHYCMKSGRTFIMCNPKENNVYEVLDTAALYQPAAVFVEDIDVLTSKGDEQAVGQYLDKFDGLRAKGKEIIGIFTTNNIERIHKGMLRPGRLDAVIQIDNHDRETMEKFIKLLFQSSDLGDINYDEVYTAVENFTPAFVKEVCEKVKLYSIARGSAVDKYETLDFLAAADEMRVHYNLHVGAGEGIKPEPIERRLKQLMAESLHGANVTYDESGYEGKVDTKRAEGRKQ